MTKDEVWLTATCNVISDMCMDCARRKECHNTRQKFDIDTGKECPEYVNAVYDEVCNIIYCKQETVCRLARS